MQLLQQLLSPKPTVNNFDANNVELGTKNVVISGITGTGKTTLCKRLIQEALETDRKVYVTTNDSIYKDAFASENYRVNFYDHCELWQKEAALSMLDRYQSIPTKSLIIIDEGSMSDIREATKFKQQYSCSFQVVVVSQSFAYALESLNPQQKKEILGFYKKFLFATQSISDSNVIENLPGCSEVLNNIGSDINRYNWLEVKYS